jgi:hypothetical protein
MYVLRENDPELEFFCLKIYRFFLCKHVFLSSASFLVQKKRKKRPFPKSGCILMYSPNSRFIANDNISKTKKQCFLTLNYCCYTMSKPLSDIYQPKRSSYIKYSLIIHPRLSMISFKTFSFNIFLHHHFHPRFMINNNFYTCVVM